MRNKLYVIVTVVLVFIAAVILKYADSGYAELRSDNIISDTMSKNTVVKILREDLQDTIIDKKYLLGKFNPAEDSNFVRISMDYASQENTYLQKEVYKAFVEMYNAAMKKGVRLTIISATRNFDCQKRIWENKWNGLKKSKDVTDTIEKVKVILKYSSMPGTSRHHWGTDVDIYSLNNKDFETGEGGKIYSWLYENAYLYGFCQVYTAKDSLRLMGHEEEKWHWSYIPLADFFLKNYEKHVTYHDLTGFSGCEAAEKAGAIRNYVLGINKNCY